MSSRPSRGAARLAAILDALPDALLLVNCNGTVVNANAIALEAFEAPGTALVGRGLLDLLPSFDSKRIPGSMRRAGDEPSGRTKPTRMIARRTDGSEFHVEVTSANLEDGRTPYAQPDHYTGDELLMLVVRDLTGTLDTEAELARQQRQTEMILRAAAEGVIGVDTEGKVVLVNPSAAQILGYRATDLGGRELHPLIHHSRADGSPLPVEESPLTDTLRSGRKHRVRGVALWRKDGKAVPVDLTTAPVREGDQLVGAVMTFTDRSRMDALVKRHEQLHAVLETSLRGPIDELRRELAGLAADPAGQLWPEANQILHHLSAGYSRITTLIDNVLVYQRLESGASQLQQQPVGLNDIVAAGVEGAVELIGPGRAQYAVHAPPVAVVLDGERMAQALAHLIADTVGIDATGTSGTGDSTVVVAAAQRGDVARIEVRGPHSGGHPVHLPMARGIVERHGGVLQSHEVPGQGSAYVVEVPIGEVPEGASLGQVPRGNETTVMPVPAQSARGTAPDGPGTGDGEHRNGNGNPQGGGSDHPGESDSRPPRQRRRAAGSALALPAGPSAQQVPVPQQASPADEQAAIPRPTGRRRAAPRAGEHQGALPELPSGGSGHGDAANNVPAEHSRAALEPAPPSGRRARRAVGAPEAPQQQVRVQPVQPPQPAQPAPPQPVPPQPVPPRQMPHQQGPSGQAPGPRGPVAQADQQQQQVGGMRALGQGVQVSERGEAGDTMGGQNLLLPTPSGRRRKLAAPPENDARLRAVDTSAKTPAPSPSAVHHHAGAPAVEESTPEAGQRQSPPRAPAADPARPAPQRHPVQPQHPTQPPPGAAHLQPVQEPPLQAPSVEQPPVTQDQGRGERDGTDGDGAAAVPAGAASAGPAAGGDVRGDFVGAATESDGRAFTIDAPAEGSEGPELLEELASVAEPDHPDNDNPRRLLVWPEPDVSTRQALTDRGYRPVIVRSREEVNAQIAEFPAALFVDPLTGPITRTALQSLRTAAVAAEVPVLVTAGLGQATREAAYGADPAVLLKALAPRDTEQHPSRVLLVEGHPEIATAFTATLERRGMHVVHAASEADAVTMASEAQPNLVVMDLMLIRRRRVGIVDWLRGNGQLNRTPLVVYTSVDIDPTELPRLRSGETVLFLAERSTNSEVQGRIVDLLGKIGARVARP